MPPVSGGQRDFERRAFAAAAALETAAAFALSAGSTLSPAILAANGHFEAEAFKDTSTRRLSGSR
jgi:hypothetical protein